MHLQCCFECGRDWPPRLHCLEARAGGAGQVGVWGAGGVRDQGQLHFAIRAGYPAHLRGGGQLL
ncbi:hypothetical protein LINPERPRIM_LOCUS43036 [Linum perenne]